MRPANRLLLFIALLTPLGLVPVVIPALNTSVLMAVILIFIGIATDLFKSLGILDSVQVDIGNVNRMTHNRAAKIELSVSGECTIPQITIALDLPGSIVSNQNFYHLTPPDKGKILTLYWPVTAQVRGSFNLARVVLAGYSNLGLWEIRRTQTLDSEIRVYPDLLTERRNLSSLFLYNLQAGNRMRRQGGQGREFEKIREYIPGDSMDQIHWKATAKRNTPMSKVYQVERTQEVYVIIDSSRLSGVNVHDSEGNLESQLELFMKSTLVTALIAQKQGDHFGLCIFSNQVDSFLRAKGGKEHFNACRDKLFMLQSNPVSPDYQELSTFLRLKIRKRSLLIILTNLDDPVLAEEFIAGMDLINRQHLVLVMSINPQSAQTLFTNDKIEQVDDIYRALAGHMQDRSLQTLTARLRRRGIHMYRPDPGKLSLQIVNQYMWHKEKL